MVVSRFVPLSRRALLRLLLGTAAAVAVVGWLGRRIGRRVVERYYREVTAFPNDTPAGSLAADTMAALTAVAAALLPAGVSLQRYEAQFRWRATNRRGYRDLYERFATALDRAAREAGAARFVSADRRTQEQILEHLARIRRVILERDLLSGLQLALFERNWLVFERCITRDVLALFAQTDAWLLAGYPAHPGQPRGLETYQQPLGPLP